MGDKYHRRMTFFLDPLKFLQNFSLGDGIDCRCRFICHQKCRLHRQCQPNHDSLKHSSGKLVWILPQHFLRIMNSHFFQYFQGNLPDLCPIPICMGCKGLGHLASNPVKWIKAGHRILENHAYLLPTQPPQFIPSCPA